MPKEYRFHYGANFLTELFLCRSNLLTLGESIELQYALHSYGIPTDHIPITFSGNIKDGYIKQWVKMRGYAESQQYKPRIIECPQLEDVLFRQGVSSVSYPGNTRVYRLVQKRYPQDLLTIKAPKRGEVKTKRRKVILEIIDDINSNGGRFLAWNDNGWWSEICKFEPLSVKLEYLIKEILRMKRKEERLARSSHRIHLDCSTSAFREDFDEGSCARSKRTKLDHRVECLGGGRETRQWIEK